METETQTFKWAAAFSLSVKTPVDSTMYSAPVSPQGISSGFLSHRTQVDEFIIIIIIIFKENHNLCKQNHT